MKNLNKFKSIALAGLISTGFIACKDDDESVTDDIINATTSVEIYATNNTNGNVTVYDVDDINAVTTKGYFTTNSAADGIYYDESDKTVVFADRSGNRLLGSDDFDEASDGDSITMNVSSPMDMDSPREVAVNGDFYVVADNANQTIIPGMFQNRLFVYNKNGRTFSLRNIITVDFAVWGISFDDDDLYVVVDRTGDIAKFNNFLGTTTNATLTPSKRITIEGITRTHGITYDDASETMILTDIGDANLGNDGGFHLISNWDSKFGNVADGGTMPVAGNQVRVSGSNTQMGNPVDVAYDRTTSTVYIAEASNGKFLAFNDIGNGGNLSPKANINLAGASSVHFVR